LTVRRRLVPCGARGAVVCRVVWCAV